MLTKLYAGLAGAIAATSMYTTVSGRSALVLRQENQATYWDRHNTVVSGVYRSGRWVEVPMRSAYGEFRGGGPGSGK